RDSDPSPVRTQVGAVHHLSFHIDHERFEDVMAALEEDGHHFNVFDRGIFHSLYTRDHNGLLIELSTDKYDIPNERRGEVLATANRIKDEDDDANFVEEPHIEAALEELGMDATRHELPDSPTGVGVED
ncbi:MAG: VOC family protein, partial [Candidatus Nanohaloarchaea archaeon]|nr:VOC family protein [Candidatus Nanohaloarchaea archaeon]